MPEKIAMTPPDLNGQQVLWEKKGSCDGGLWLPNAGSPAEDVLLGFSQSGPESLQDLQVKRSVRVASQDGVFYRVWTLINEDANHYTARERHMTWLRSNIMLNAAIVHPETDDVEVIIEDKKLKVRTPDYFGSAHFLDEDNGFHSLVAMSDESEGRDSMPKDLYGDNYVGTEMNRNLRELLSGTYPEYGLNLKVWLDNNRHNILYGESKEDLVRIDVNGGIGLTF